MANYKKLIAWQKAHRLAVLTYKATKEFPKEETFGITLQLRRAALSIPTNIVEGYNRKSKKEFVRFIDISLGSLAEVEYLIDFAQEVGYSGGQEVNEIKDLIKEVGKLLWKLQKSKLQP
ncbi:MAG TPA: four helix bundle protein [Nitrospirae bacterium]|nr:four helix bundle protein [Nitrospirota bacterium]